MSANSPIRFRLRTALFIAVAFSVLLSIFFAVSYVSIKASLLAKSDAEVSEQLDAVLASPPTVWSQAEFLRRTSLHNVTGEAAIGFRLILPDEPQMHIPAVGPSRICRVLELQPASLPKAPINVEFEKNTIRVLARSNRGAFLFGAINTVAFQEVFDAMLRTYFLLLATGIIASFILAMITARLALRPLKILVDSARVIKDNQSSDLAGLPTDTRTVEMNELAAVINEVLEQRDRNIAALRDFTANAAHELRTPLTILKGELEVDLRTKDLSESEKESVLSNLEEVERLVRIVEDLLTLARAEQREIGLAEKADHEFLLSELIEEITSRLQAIARQAGIEFSISAAPGLHINLPPEEVSHIIFNVLLNAVQQSPEHTVVELTTEYQDDGAVVLVIRDHGEGMGPEQIPHIFDRFWRSDASRRRREGGTGLGLTIAKTFADRNGITLRCESEIGKGTSMMIAFPKDSVTQS